MTNSLIIHNIINYSWHLSPFLHHPLAKWWWSTPPTVGQPVVAAIYIFPFSLKIAIFGILANFDLDFKDQAVEKMRYRFLQRIHNETTFQAASVFCIIRKLRVAVSKICFAKDTPLFQKHYFGENCIVFSMNSLIIHDLINYSWHLPPILHHPSVQCRLSAVPTTV